MVTKRKRFSLLGRPVKHSLSPAMHRAACRACELPHTYSAVDVPSAESFRRLVVELQRGVLAGMNVTMPFKRLAAELATEASDEVRALGAANFLMRGEGNKVVAENLDVDALEAELEGRCQRRVRAAILGSGGAALAAVAACKRLGFSVIGVTSRSWSSSDALIVSSVAEQFRRMGALTSVWPSSGMPTVTKASAVMRLVWSELAEGADLVVQATSAGMVGADPGHDVAKLIPFRKLAPDAVVYDVVYGAQPTPVVAAATEAGLRSAGGLGMLIRQAELTFELWHGTPPPEGVMEAAAREELARQQEG